MRTPPSVLFRAERLPVLQNKTFASAAEALDAPAGDVVLVQDSRTGLVHNCSFEGDRLIYDASYQNEQACSATFRRHLDAAAEIIERHLRGRSLLEIGCGKGYFLELLGSRGFSVTGVDPAYEGTSPHIVKGLFSPGLGLAADGIVLRHVLEHIRDPHAFLADVAAANGQRGIVYIEVPCFDWILARRAWFDIFYEHVNYFRQSDFVRAFGRIYESGHLFGGQYLYVVADLGSLRPPGPPRADRVEIPADFLSGLSQSVERARAGARNGTAIWGAASKGVIFCLAMRRAGVAVDAVIDINPLKQGRFMGGSGLQILSPADGLRRLSPGATIFVMNENYLEEVLTSTGHRYSCLVAA